MQAINLFYKLLLALSCCYIICLSLDAQTPNTGIPIFDHDKQLSLIDFTQSEKGELIFATNRYKRNEDNTIVSSEIEIYNLGKFGEREIWNRKLTGGQYQDCHALTNHKNNTYVLGTKIDTIVPIEVLPGRKEFPNWVSYYSLPYLTKLDNNGKIVWQKEIGSIKFKSFYDVFATARGNLYLYGHVPMKGNVLIKLDAEGIVLWTKTVQRFKSLQRKTEILSVKEDRNQNTYCLSEMYDNPHFELHDYRNVRNPYNFKVSKFNKEGQLIKEWKGPSKLINLAQDLAVHNDGTVLVSGSNYYEDKIKPRQQKIKSNANIQADVPNQTQGVLFVLNKSKDKFEHYIFRPETAYCKLVDIIELDKAYMLVGQKKTEHKSPLDLLIIGLDKELSVFYDKSFESYLDYSRKVLLKEEEQKLFQMGYVAKSKLRQIRNEHLFEWPLKEYFDALKEHLNDN